MSFKGTFKRYSSQRLNGTVMFSFTLECTNWIQDETVDIGIFPSDGGQPWYFRKQKLKVGKSYDFNFDTVGWEWYQHDTIAILGNEDKIKQKWQLNLPEYAPGECPECHGTHKCRACNGQGFVYPPNMVWEYKTCKTCGGTGICRTCHVPKRTPRFGGGPTGLGNGY